MDAKLLYGSPTIHFGEIQFWRHPLDANYQFAIKRVLEAGICACPSV